VIGHPSRNLSSARNCIKTVSKPRSLHLGCIKTLHLVGLAVDLLEGLALHLQLHLRVLLKDLGVALPKHLGDPLVRHTSRAEPGGVRRAQVVNPKIGGVKGLNSSSVLPCKTQIERLVTALHAEAKAGAPAGTLFGQSIATALAVYLAQRYSSSLPVLRNYRGGISKVRLNRVLEYIAAKLQDDMSLSALADIAGMNLYHFSRLFKQSTGFSPHRYVLEQRIRRGQQLLRTSDMTVLEASVRSGFADQGHFTKVFRRFAGVTPTEYRAQSKM
jgi:AraC-like DNA-binding protein